MEAIKLNKHMYLTYIAALDLTVTVDMRCLSD